MSSKFTPAQLFKSRIFFGIILVVFILSTLSLVNEIGRRKKIQTEIDKQKDEIAKLQKENDDLTTLIDYLKSDDFVESEARSKLNLSKPGESLIVVDQSLVEKKESTNHNQIAIKWWDYFFK